MPPVVIITVIVNHNCGTITTIRFAGGFLLGGFVDGLLGRWRKRLLGGGGKRLHGGWRKRFFSRGWNRLLDGRRKRFLDDRWRKRLLGHLLGGRHVRDSWLGRESHHLLNSKRSGKEEECAELHFEDRNSENDRETELEGSFLSANASAGRMRDTVKRMSVFDVYLYEYMLIRLSISVSFT
jgi:hypothetical protein